MVCTGSGFKPDTAGWKRCEKTQKGIPGEFPPDGDLAIRGNSVDLKNALSDVYPNYRYIHCDPPHLTRTLP